ncbi:MAG TPA: ABC transporter substrate-binding protein [Acidimicrobiales bacterium]|nr:ABC transporter substrate-binding protein [Acidimicrobiales bacterium]
MSIYPRPSAVAGVRHRWAASLACAAALTGVVPALASASVRPASDTTILGFKFPTSSVQAARAEAASITGGKRIGGSADFLGVVTGLEENAILAGLEPFEQATGINVRYEGTTDQIAVLNTRVAAGDPPDVVFAEDPEQLIELARRGKLVPLNGVVDMASMDADFAKPLLRLGTVDGKLYAYYAIVNYHGLIWYDSDAYNGPKNPATWSQLSSWAASEAAKGETPWCLGLNSGATTGWPATNELLEFLFVRRYGPALAAKWENGQLPWTSPQVTWAFEELGTLAGSSYTPGGGQGAVSTSYLQAGADLYASPPACMLYPQAQWFGSYAPAAIKGATAANTRFFTFPSINKAFSNVEMVDGNQIALLRDTAQGRALVAFMSTPQYQTMVAETGQLLVPDSAVPASAYPTALSRRFAQDLVINKRAQAQTIELPSDLWSTQVVDELFKDVTAYLTNPGGLEGYLEDMNQTAGISS